MARKANTPGSPHAPKSRPNQRVLDISAFGSAEEVGDFIETVLEASTEYSIVATDLEGKIVLWNPGAGRLYGYGPKEIIGQPEAILHTEQDVEAGLPAAMMETARRKGKWEGTVQLRRKSDGRFTAYAVATPLRDRNGRPTGFLVISSDVSEAFGQARALEGTQSYTRSLIESNLDPLIATDAKGVITDVNTQTLRVTGHTREELIGSEFKSHFTEPRSAEEAIQLALREGKATNYELTMRAKDGRETIVSYNANTLHDDEGRLRVLATARDVTERRLAEERFRWLLESAADAMVIVDGKGEIVLTNARTEKLFGYTHEELAGRSFDSLIPRHRDGHEERPTDWIHDLTAHPTAAGLELCALRKDGTEFPVEVSLCPLETEDGVLATAAIRDITERRAAESKFRGLLESARDAMVIVDKKGEIMLTNAQTERLFGFTREELVGQRIETLMPERYRELFVREGLADRPIEILTPASGHDGREPSEDPKGAGLDLWAIRKDGTEFPVEISLRSLETEEGVLATAAIRDTTERKRVEEQLRETNLELEAANQAKDRFLASMSHELRTPLNAVLGFTGTILMGLSGPLTAEQTKQLETVQANGKHLLSIINDLLDLSKIESGKIELSFEQVDCGALVEEVVSGLRPLADEKGIALQSEVPDQAVVVDTDRRSLSQVLINLASNAIKYTDEGSVRVELSSQGNGNPVTRFSVVDTGVGIEPADRDKLFAAFQQVASYATRQGNEGTGLGLYISQRLAQLIRGEIDVESEYGKGSKFVLELQAVDRR